MRDEIRRYYDRKTKCPTCNSDDLVETEINILDLPEGKYIDRKNVTICKNCNWRGFIDELKG